MAPDRPRIVHLITRLDLGGAQQNTLYCVRHHDRARFEVALFAGRGGLLDKEARAIEGAEIKLLDALVHPIAPFRDVAVLAQLASALAGADLVHTHSSKAGVLGRWAARWAGVRAVVHTVHGWSFNDSQPGAVRRAYVELERAAARVTDRLVCVAEADRSRGLAEGIGHERQYVVLRSGIEPAAYVAEPGARARVRAALGFGDADVVVGTIGNLKAQKAPLDLVEAARRAFARDPRMRFMVAGDGPLRRETERALAYAGLVGVTRLLGWRDDIADLLAAMDVFLLTSRFEGLPRAALQAIAASVPVVATDTGGISEIIHDGESGYLVPVADVVAAADRLVVLAGDPALRSRMSGAARARLGAEFDIRTLVGDLEHLYDELLGRATTR